MPKRGAVGNNRCPAYVDPAAYLGRSPSQDQLHVPPGLREHIAHEPADDIIRLQAGQGSGRMVEDQDTAPVIHRHHAVVGGFKEIPHETKLFEIKIHIVRNREGGASAGRRRLAAAAAVLSMLSKSIAFCSRRGKLHMRTGKVSGKKPAPGNGGLRMLCAKPGYTGISNDARVAGFSRAVSSRCLGGPWTVARPGKKSARFFPAGGCTGKVRPGSTP